MAHRVWVTVRVWGWAALPSRMLTRLREAASGWASTSARRARAVAAS